MISCDICKDLFKDNTKFIKHVRLTHTGLKTFRCTGLNCEKKFVSLDSFLKHRRAKHSSKTVENAFSSEDQSDLLISHFAALSSEVEAECLTAAFDSLTDHYSSDTSDSDSSFSEDDLMWENENSTVNLTQEITESTKSVVDDKATKYVAQLYSFHDLTRIRINTVINATSELFQSSLNSLRNQICSKLETQGVDQSYLSSIKDIIENFEKTFKNIQTESQRFAHFKNKSTFIFPQSYKIGERVEFKSKPTGTTRESVSVDAQFIPLRRVLKHFFEIPGVFSSTMEYVSSLKLNTQIIYNIIQTPHWQAKIARHGLQKIVLPFILFFDDYEPNNPLGSHKGVSKCGAVYISLPCLPPNYQSKLENIFMFILFNTLDRSTFKNHIIFEKVIEEIKFLQEEGICLKLSEGEIKVFFELALIVGDNLGLHSIFGFIESFVGTKFCRFCLTNYKDINKVFSEKDCIFRDIQNYISSFGDKNQIKSSGIKEFCIFNRIPGFHVTQNPAVDVMHDFLEGICRYDLALILNHFIYKRQYFSLELLNNLIRSFYYGPKKSVNKPPEILESHLKNKCIILSAAEMQNLIKNFNLMIGCYVDENDQHWQLLLSLKEISEIIFSKKVTRDTPIILECKISEYLKLLVDQFPLCLKPKHHFLIHYPTVMKQIGPLWNITCMRFEGKHREGKTTAKSSICRINVCRTIALRHQLNLNYRFLRKHVYPVYVSGSTRLMSIEQLPDISNYSKLILNVINESNISTTNWVEYNGMTIKKDSIIISFSELGEEFCSVHLIILKNEKEFFLVVKSIPDCYFNEHLRAYKIYDKELYQWEVLKLDNLKNVEVSYVNKMRDGHFYINKSWF